MNPLVLSRGYPPAPSPQVTVVRCRHYQTCESRNRYAPEPNHFCVLAATVPTLRLWRSSGRALRLSSWPMVSPLMSFVDELANERHGFIGSFFHEPVAGSLDNCFLDIVGDVPHDLCLQWPEGSLTANGEDRHG
jgi:hypothetical protein